jgi:uridine kinase
MNTAIIITGTICSGKSTISEKIQKELNIKLINELNVSPKGLLGMKSAIKNNEYKGVLLIEHFEILNIINDIDKNFKKIIIILLNVSDSILIENLNTRKSQNITGNYLKVDILERKKYILEQYNKINDDYEKYIANIEVYEDYDLEYNKIINIIKNYINK